MKLYCVQHDIAWEDKAANHARIRTLLAAAPPEPGSLVLLPEMFSTGFSMNVAGIAERDDRETETFLANTARALGVYLLAGVVNRAEDGRGRNEAIAFAPNGVEIARYLKMHPFTPGGETEHYHRGGFPVSFEWSGLTVAPFICYDLRFPEVFRSIARDGAHLMAVISSWPDKRIDHWVKLLQARAIENQCYVAGVNRVGDDPFHRYVGRSLIVDYRGEIVADAGEVEAVIAANLDLEMMEKYREGLPFLRDMRPEFVRRI